MSSILLYINRLENFKINVKTNTTFNTCVIYYFILLIIFVHFLAVVCNIIFLTFGKFIFIRECITIS